MKHSFQFINLIIRGSTYEFPRESNSFDIINLFYFVIKYAVFGLQICLTIEVFSLNVALSCMAFRNNLLIIMNFKGAN